MQKNSVMLLVILCAGIVTVSQTLALIDDASWTYPRHDERNTGFSSSRVPVTNQTAWIRHEVTSLTPIVSDGRVYCTGGKFVNLTVLDEKDGKVLWTKGLGSFSTPVIVSGVIYVGTVGGEIWALDSNTGDIIWKYSIYGYSEPLNSPQVADGRIFFNNRDGWLFCINATNGEFIWKYETRLAEAAHLAVADGRVFTMYSCLNATDGTLLWEYGEKPVGIGWTYHTPTVDNGKVLLSIGPSLNAVDEFNGSLMWKFDTEQDASDSAVAYGKVFVSADGYLYCLNEENGKVDWKYNDIALAGWLSSIPSVADNKVLVPAYDKLLCVDANNGSLLWTYSTITSRTLPVVADDMVLFSASGGIVAIGNRVPESTNNLGLIVTLACVVIVALAVFALILKRRAKPKKNTSKLPL